MTEGTGLHVTEIGDGPPVAFLHGLFGQGKNWTQVAKALAAADPSYRSILLDMPNHGRSQWSEAIDYPAMADQVARALQPYGPVRLVGHSMGGKIAMKIALRHPELVERLCVVDISPVDYHGLSSFGDYVTGMRSLDLSTLADRAGAEEHLKEYAPDPVVRSFLLQNLRRVPTSEGGGWRWQPNLELIAAHLDQLGAWPEADGDENPNYSGPTLWVAGAESDYITAEYGEPMRALFPRVAKVSIKNSGHWVHSAQPEVFVATLRRFLDHDFEGTDRG